MARWQPNARERLVAAALDLFEERGYEHTTVIEIAERAGLTKSSFFRHFQDKREVLFGSDAMAVLLVETIAGAPEDATPFEAVAEALDAVGREHFTPARRETVARRRAVIAANPELREREALKGLGIVASTTAALERRGVPELVSCVTAELAAIAMTIAHDRWTATADGEGSGRNSGENSDEDSDEDFGRIARRALGEVRAAAGAAN